MSNQTDFEQFDSGSFHVEKCLRRDAFGDIYRASVIQPVYDLMPGEHVALKVIFPRNYDDPHLEIRIQREVEIGMVIRSPNVARIYGIEPFDDFLGDPGIGIIMELIEGTCLDRYLAGNEKFAEPEIRDIARQALEALSEIHSMGVIHRDVKPQNLLLTQTRRLVLLNLGIAKLIDYGISLTTTGTFLGTWAYASPELLSGVSTLDQRSDLYSLGVVLYELATGVNPFKTDNLMEALQIHEKVEPVNPGTINRDLSLNLRKIIMRLLSKNPGGRPEKAADVIKMLDTD
ncbi:serine/threonine protein kinase [bacterium]|nr:serine/threonine protein kinase [candidate division CSSED10-310 bacterium]